MENRRRATLPSHPPADTTRALAGLMALALVAALVVLASIASATEGTGNQVEDWCDDGIKIEDPDTPFVVPAPPEGTTWALLIIKAGSSATQNFVVTSPPSGTTYLHPSGKEISHVILCYQEATTTTTTSAPPSGPTTTTPDDTPVGGVPAGGGGCADGTCDTPWWNGNPVAVLAVLFVLTLAAIGAGTYYLTR